jgi:hypothetical protein
MTCWATLPPKIATQAQAQAHKPRERMFYMGWLLNNGMD